MIDYAVRIIQFPPGKVREAVTEDANGFATIFLDANLTYENQQERFLHAIRHLANDDFSGDDVQEIETEAHRK